MHSPSHSGIFVVNGYTVDFEVWRNKVSNGMKKLSIRRVACLFLIDNLFYGNVTVSAYVFR